MSFRPTLRQRLRSERGMTLIETLVVMLVLGVLAIASITMISGLFNANLRSQQMASQQASSQGAVGYLTARLGAAKAPLNNLVSADNSTWTDPLTIGPDQLVFESAGDCYRVFYVEATKTIKAAKANGSCDAATTIRPKRYPNETVTSSCQGATPTQMRSSCNTNPKYDPTLDTDNGSFVLATGVQARDHEDGLTNVFRYLDSNGTAINYDRETPGTPAGPYTQRTNMNNVAAVELIVPVDGTAGGANSTQIRIRTTKQKIWIGGSGGTGAAGGGATPEPVVGALPTNPADGDAVVLQTPAMATQGVRWTLRYNSSSSSASKWEFEGGSPLTATAAGGTANQSSTVWAHTKHPSSPQIALPVAGDYMVTFGASVYHTGASNVGAELRILIGNDTQDLGGFTGGFAAGDSQRIGLSSSARVTDQAQGARMQIWTSASIPNIPLYLYGPRIEIVPIRVR